MPPSLQTQRLNLRMPRYDDLPDIYRLGRNPRVMRYINGGQPQTMTEARADLDRRIHYNRHPMGYWVVELRPNRAFLGWVALKELPGSSEVELGYRLLEEYWGRGYATEASREVLRYGFEQLQLPKIVAVALEPNIASTRVMEKLGFRFERFDRFYGCQCVYYTLPARQYFGQMNSV